MKKALSIGILFILLVHMAGFYAYFTIRMIETHAEMRKQLAQLPAKDLTLFIFDISEVKNSWIEEMEFKWEGKMYDIARVEKAGHQVKIFALHDSAEDNLLAFLDSVTRKASCDPDPVPVQVIQFVLLSFLPTLQWEPSHLWKTIHSSNTAYLGSESDRSLSVASPPPKI